jgi:hypothetical protein
MKITFEEACILLNTCLKAQQYELAVKFRDEQKRLWKRLPKAEKLRLIAMSENGNENENPITTIHIHCPVSWKEVAGLSKFWKPV